MTEPETTEIQDEATVADLAAKAEQVTAIVTESEGGTIKDTPLVGADNGEHEAVFVTPIAPAHIRLSVFSEVKLDLAGNARPIHILRTGTFTDSSGRSFTFEPKHLESIVANYARRPNPPITESHDYGRAVGRMAALRTDGTNLFGTPNWNQTGKQLIQDGVYDGYSCELDPDGSEGFVKIGGSLTNYPAVKGLSPVTLAAPSIDVLVLQPTTEVIPMAEETLVADVATPTPIALETGEVSRIINQAVAQSGASLSDEMRNQIIGLTQQQITLIKEQAQAEARREIQYMQQQQRVLQFSQDMTTPALNRPHALPLDTERLAKFLNGLGADAYKEAQALFSQVLTAGLLSFEEFGSAAAGEKDADPVKEYEDALAAELKVNSVRSVALANLQKKHPTIVAAYNKARKGVR